MVGEDKIVRSRAEDQTRHHAGPNAPQQRADRDYASHTRDRGDHRGESGRELRDLPGRQRGERDAPAEQLRLVQSFVGHTPYVGHEPMTVFDHVPRKQHPARVVRLPDRRGAYRDRENHHREREHGEERSATMSR